MARPGLPQGYVMFGSVAHLILKHIYECGESTQVNLIEELGLSRDLVSNCLQRLLRYKYIKRAGKLDGYQYNCVTQTVYVLSGMRGLLMKRYESKRKTGAERMRKLRATRKAAKLAVPSVFAYGESFA